MVSVNNLSSTTLTTEEYQVLEKGLNFALAPKQIPFSDFIASVESAIDGCSVEDKGFVRRRVSAILKRARRPKSNFSASELSALKSLRNNSSIMVMPADKGNVTVIMDTCDYLHKLSDLVSAGPYVERARDPGNSYRKLLYQILEKVVRDGRLTQNQLLQLVPTHFQTPHIFGLPKVHKPDVPLRPIISMAGSLFSPVARLLANIMRPFTVSHASYVSNSCDVIQKLRDFDPGPGFFVSFDVESLFTNVPVAETLAVFRSLLSSDPTLGDRTQLTVEEIMSLMEIVLTSCYFRSFDGLFLQTEGVAMGGSLGPIAANIFMAHFEELARNLAVENGFQFPSLWLRYVDDILSYWTASEDDLSRFTSFLNNIRSTIKFSSEREEGRSIPFLDILIERAQDGLVFSVYRKPTHTGRYLHRDSSHPRSVFKGVVRSLACRASSICSSERLQAEKQSVVSSLKACGYSDLECRKWWRTERPNDKARSPRFEGVLPYVRGVSERIKNVLKDVGVAVALRAPTTMRNLLVRKRPEKAKAFGVVYRIPCSSSDCAWSYVGESGRTVEERVKEHQRAIRDMDVGRSEIARHVLESDHHVDVKLAKVIDREPQWRKRTIKEAIWTRRYNSFNRTKHVLSEKWLLSNL